MVGQQRIHFAPRVGIVETELDPFSQTPCVGFEIILGDVARPIFHCHFPRYNQLGIAKTVGIASAEEMSTSCVVPPAY